MRFSGALPEAPLEQLIARARELDMDEVRATIAKSLFNNSWLSLVRNGF